MSIESFTQKESVAAMPQTLASTVLGDELSDAEMAAVSGGKHEFKHAIHTVGKSINHAANDVGRALKNFFG